MSLKIKNPNLAAGSGPNAIALVNRFLDTQFAAG
jgi:hypothetical protein